MSGQSIMDRVTAAKHSIAGQGLAKTVCKATTEEVLGPKRKHLDYLLQCTNEPNVSIPQLADLLIERTQQSNWVIVFKALITIHNLMNYGNERFTQYLASNNCSFNLSNFIDKTGVQGYDMSTFIRRYARYLNEKAYTYRIMAFDFCKVKRGRDDGLLRTMNSEKLLKTLPALQKQIDALLEFDCTSNELTNGVINASFMLLFKDLIRLFACYNDGTINLLEKYFDMNKKNCKEALDIYKKFLVRMDKVSEFLKVAENVGIDKGDIPDLAKGLVGKSGQAPASLLDALEQHLASLEGKKGAAPTSAKPTGFNSAVNTMSSNSSIQISDEEKKKILDEESKQLEQLKESHQDVPVSVDLLSSDEPQEQKNKEQASAASPSQPPQTTTNPFAAPPPASTAQNASPSRPSDDLLNLNDNPFSSTIQNVMQMNTAANAFGAPAWGPSTSTTGGFNNNFAQFPNGTGGSPSIGLDTSTSTTSALPLTPSPSKLPQTEGITFDPFDSLLDVESVEGVTNEGATGLFSAPLPPTGDLESPGGLLLGPQIAPDDAQGMPGWYPVPYPVAPLTVTPVTPAMGRKSPIAQSESPALDVFSGDAFSTTTTAFSQDTTSDLFPTTGAFSTSDTDQSAGFDAFGEIMQPVGSGAKKPETSEQQTLSQKDLDSNLALLAGNISINGAESVKKPQHQWQPKGEQKKTGGDNWASPNLSSATTWGAQPTFNQSAPVRPMMGAGFGQPQPMMQPGMMPMGGGMAPMGGMGMAPMAGGMAPMGTGMAPQPMGMGMAPMGQPAMFGAGVRPGMQPMGTMNQAPPPSQPNDPFGAL